MAKLYKTLVENLDGTKRELWVAESNGMTIMTGDTPEDAAQKAYDKLMACADIARANRLPNRYVRRLIDEANVFRSGKGRV